MKDLSLRSPVTLAVAIGATSPVPATGERPVIWSTTTNCLLAWDGKTWQPSGGGYLGGEGVDRPVTLPTAAVGSAGALTGTYYYVVTFITANGETDCTTFPPTPVTVSSQQVNLTNIPISSHPAVTGRGLYRNHSTNGNTVDFPKLQLVAVINNNTATTYTDNLADASLGRFIPRISTTQDRLMSGGLRAANFNSLTSAVGLNAMVDGTGYACTAFGGNTMNANKGGSRNSAFGVFALYSNQNGDEHTAVGVHALNNVNGRRSSSAFGYAAAINWVGSTDNDRITAIGAYAFNSMTTNGGGTGVGYAIFQNNQTGYNLTGIGEKAGWANTTGVANTYAGYQAGYNSTTVNFNTALGSQALEAANGGSSTAVGALAGQGATGGNGLFLGAFSGMYETSGSRFCVDTYYRGSLADQQANALMYGTFGGTPDTQRLNINALMRPAQLATSGRPAWASGLKGFMYFDITTNKLVLAGASAWETITSA